MKIIHGYCEKPTIYTQAVKTNGFDTVLHVFTACASRSDYSALKGGITS